MRSLVRFTYWDIEVDFRPASLLLRVRAKGDFVCTSFLSFPPPRHAGRTSFHRHSGRTLRQNKCSLILLLAFAPFPFPFTFRFFPQTSCVPPPPMSVLLEYPLRVNADAIFTFGADTDPPVILIWWTRASPMGKECTSTCSPARSQSS